MAWIRVFSITGTIRKPVAIHTCTRLLTWMRTNGAPKPLTTFISDTGKQNAKSSRCLRSNWWATFRKSCRLTSSTSSTARIYPIPLRWKIARKWVIFTARADTCIFQHLRTLLRTPLVRQSLAAAKFSWQILLAARKRSSSNTQRKSSALKKWQIAISRYYEDSSHLGRWRKSRHACCRFDGQIRHSDNFLLALPTRPLEEHGEGEVLSYDEPVHRAFKEIRGRITHGYAPLPDGPKHKAGPQRNN